MMQYQLLCVPRDVCAELTKFATAVDTSDEVEHIAMSMTILLLEMRTISEVDIGDLHLPSDDVSVW